jgi:hypothetical protein
MPGYLNLDDVPSMCKEAGNQAGEHTYTHSYRICPSGDLTYLSTQYNTFLGKCKVGWPVLAHLITIRELSRRRVGSVRAPPFPLSSPIASSLSFLARSPRRFITHRAATSLSSTLPSKPQPCGSRPSSHINNMNTRLYHHNPPLPSVTGTITSSLSSNDDGRHPSASPSSH